MKLPVVLERLAQQDLEGHVDYIAADRPPAAVRFVDAAEAAFARLAEMPRIGAVRDFRNPRLEGIRFWPIPDFEKYLIFYRVTGEEGNSDAQEKVTELKASRSKSLEASGGEHWVLNKAIHYNEWANFSKEDFEPVVKAFKELLLQFLCDKCDSWLYVTPKKDPVELRCNCAEFHLNLKSK